MSKIITLDQFKQLATKVKTEDDALGAQISAVATKVEGLITTGGEANVLEGVMVNDVALDIADKMVNILIASGEENGTISVNGAAVAIKGLQDMAFKAKVSEADLDDALLAAIAAMATDADLEALTVRVTTAEGEITELRGYIEALQNAGYQTSEQIQTAIQTAISEANHLTSKIVDVVPSDDEAEENVWYMIKNEETGHYDIYTLVNGKVEYIDDTTVDLSNYSTTEQMNAAISAAIEALNIGDYAKAADLVAAVSRITALETALDNYYTKEEAEAKFTDEEEAGTIAANAVTAAQATNEEFQNAMNEVWTPSEG